MLSMRRIHNTLTKTATGAKLLALLLLLPTSLHASQTNQLAEHASPYLALHGNDPVAWQDWSDDVLKTAQKENKLIFVSSGYFSCHWCHVMQQESFKDKAVAARLNKLAVSVKVDRELQPALDAWLIDFTQRTSGHAGWPLNVFLTPDGYPLVGITYMPKQNFSDLLAKLQQRWKTDEKLFRDTAIQAFRAMQPKPEPFSTTRLQAGTGQTLTERLQQQALSQADDISGGFGKQNKFPMSPQLLALLDSLQRHPNEPLKRFLTLTLDQMAYLGLRDHLGGGFFRYTVDPVWNIPHFEKMLYDNALLSQVYLRGAAILNRPEYRDIAFDTLDFVHARMQNPAGGYVASLSAVDDHNIEGGYYLWSGAELEKLLNKQELALVGRAWGIRGTPYLPDGHHIKQLWRAEGAGKTSGTTHDDMQASLHTISQKLIQARQQRVLPVDTKVLAAWNGLLLESFSLAAQYEPRFKKYAGVLFEVLAGRLWNGRELYRFIANGKPGGRVSLQDYAYVSRGMAQWTRISDNEQAAKTARDIASAGWQRFLNKDGWQLSESLIIPYNAREKILPDNAMPSPSASLMRALLDLEKDPAIPLDRYIDVDNRAMAAAPFWYASHIVLMNELLARKAH